MRYIHVPEGSPGMSLAVDIRNELDLPGSVRAIMLYREEVLQEAADKALELVPGLDAGMQASIRSAIMKAGL